MLIEVSMVMIMINSIICMKIIQRMLGKSQNLHLGGRGFGAGPEFLNLFSGVLDLLPLLRGAWIIPTPGQGGA